MRVQGFVLVVAAVGACAPSDAGMPAAEAGTSGDPPAETGDGPGSTGDPATSTSEGTAESAGESESESGSIPDPMLDVEAGYIAIEPVDYALDGTSYTSSRARLFYAFQPADDDPGDAPLLLFFNGGPGAATGIFFGFNTAHTTLDPNVVGDAGVADNPSSWTALGNCLWVDSRLTGFGYGVMDDPSDDAARIAEFDVANFNPMIDAADFVRALLWFWDEHPALRDNPVVLVGESYGGVRATAILELVLHYAEDDAGIYRDPALVLALQQHFDAFLAPAPGDALGPDVVATQFGHQVLVQPLLAGDAQLDQSGELLVGDDSPLFALGDEVGQPFTPPPTFYSGAEKRQYAIDFVESVGRDTSNIGEPEGWTDSVITDVNTSLRTEALLAQHLGLDPTSIPELFADARTGAYRVASAPAPDYTTDLPNSFGELQPWDIYYMSFVADVFDAFYGADVYAHDLEPTSASFGRLALRNLLWVDTFVTHATADVVVWPPSIAPAFASYAEVDWSIAMDGQIRVQYVAGAFGTQGEAAYRELELARYEGAAHSVTMTHPAELLADVDAWLD